MMVMVKGVQSNVPPIFVARMTIAPDTPPAPVGVPESTPVAAFNVNPAGSVPEKTEYVGAGVPLATKVYV